MVSRYPENMLLEMLLSRWRLTCTTVALLVHIFVVLEHSALPFALLSTQGWRRIRTMPWGVRGLRGDSPPVCIALEWYRTAVCDRQQCHLNDVVVFRLEVRLFVDSKSFRVLPLRCLQGQPGNGRSCRSFVARVST